MRPIFRKQVSYAPGVFQALIIHMARENRIYKGVGRFINGILGLVLTLKFKATCLQTRILIKSSEFYN